MIFEDEAAENMHTDPEGAGRFTGVLYSETVEGVTFEKYTPIGPV